MLNRMIFDTHAHICDSVFDADRSEVLRKAREVGVGAIVAVGENLSDAQRNIQIAEAYSIIRPAAGLYPTILDLEKAKDMRAFIRAQHAKFCAIGEVGLDFWAVKEEPKKEIQKEIFRSFIKLAEELDLPLNVHSRSAGRHAVALLLECGADRVQMHAFDGKTSAALPAAEAGFYFSIPPSVIRSRQKQKLVKNLSLAHLLVETDSPVLGPDPQKRNEPSNVTVPLKAIAELKNINPADVIDAIANNTRILYGDILKHK